MITAGIDIGSTTCKAVIVGDKEIIGQKILLSGSIPAQSARDVFSACCEESSVDPSRIVAVATTGYGRRLAQFGDMVITEIKACAIGAVYISCPHGQIHTIIDVGGQDTKVITLNEHGDVEDFAMNDKCAAGTGRFLEMLAHKLELTYEEFISAALTSETMIHMNSTCAVFAESEVVSLLAKNVSKEDIAAAAHNAIAERIASMTRRVGVQDVICLTGGGARNKALADSIESALNRKLYIPGHPQTIVALGAAIAARDKLSEKGS
ncbi:MAG: acyl-CoA dehydratase activase [Candidatus Auribacterota bacterium]|jgi:predicted CoA-substrate-specific enzyme activase|nr:acyl-CoA dehydratase activase [Candidatus Auribacterota bacterium]